MAVTLHTAPVVVTMTGEPVRDGGVLVEGDRVADVGPAARLRSDAVRERAWPGVIVPGLVNAHAHLEYGPPFADLATSGLPFPQWIAELTRRRGGMTEQDWQASARGSAHLLLQTGTTAVADVVTVGPAVQVVRSLGLQGVSYGELAGVDAAGWPQALARLEGILAAGAEGVSPHTLYTLSSQVFRDLVRTARSRGLRLHPHLAETSDEAEWVLSGTGAFAAFVERFGLDFELAGVGAGTTPVQHCDDLGGLGPDVHVAHGVHVGPDDRRLLRERETVVALCTRSNAVLRAGQAPVADYLQEGSPVALGTDSLASSPDLDLMAEARSARDLARQQGLEHPEEALLRAMTLGGAQALGQDVGTLRPGGRADLAVFDVPPEGDVAAALLEHGPGRCRATVLGGRLVHRR